MMPNRYSIKNLIKLIRNPKKHSTHIKNEPFRIFWEINNFLWENMFSEGEDFMNNDWDNLIILDACRYDFFREFNYIDGVLERKFSKGSNSGEFTRANFAGKELYDTVYITANPVWGRNDKKVFHYFEFLNEEWDKELKTVPPNEVKSKTIEAKENFPNKRIMAHFMQPHNPYIGEKGKRFREKHGEPYPDQSITEDTVEHIGEGKHPELIQDDVLTKQKLEEFYIENLEIVLEEVNELTEILDGKTVITADHGELLLEKPLPFSERKFGHPSIATRKLREVPWLTVDFDERRQITPESPIKKDNTEKNIINDRLESLGYKM